MRHGSLHKKERYKEMVKPECFIGLRKKTAVEKYKRTGDIRQG